VNSSSAYFNQDIKQTHFGLVLSVIQDCSAGLYGDAPLIRSSEKTGELLLNFSVQISAYIMYFPKRYVS